MRFSCSKLISIMAAGAAAFGVAHAEQAAFDLAGPNIDVEITRGTTTLPASRVPNLLVGDRVWMKVDLPSGQSAHYLMVATFLRGATNPPPTNWFFSCETWTTKCSREGLTLTVPAGAQQLMVFLAPHTGGDFKTLVNAVRGRPGAFVRTSQDLNQASLDRSRLETYLAAIRILGDADPARLKDAAPLLARSLAIKVDDKCLGKIAVLQAPCLAQGREALILNDGHSASIAQQLTSGPASDLAMAASSTPQLKSGYYGPFIGSMFDIARIFDSIHTAQYQYFPALTSAQGRRLALTLNAPPSFHDPKSVLVVALPAIEAPQFPPLHAADPEETLCVSKDVLVLPVEGAPLVFSTEYAHDSVLHFIDRDGSSTDVEAHADPARGGFVLEAAALRELVQRDPVTASFHGQWGFEHFDGPSFRFANPNGKAWNLAAGDSTNLIVGRPGTIHLQADSVSCLEDITLVDAAAKQWPVDWKQTSAREVEVTLPLQEVKPGEMSLGVKQFGGREIQRIPLRAFSEAGHLERFSLHAGDIEGVLDGNRLDEVQSLSLQKAAFTPGVLSTHDGRDQLAMLTDTASAAALKPADARQATVTLKDGRAYTVKVVIDSPRPSASLISKTVKLPATTQASGIQLAAARDVPLQAELSFSLRARSPQLFTHQEKLEVATTDRSSSVVLDVGSGGMTLQSASVAVVTLNLRQSFGDSAFGPLRFRRIIDGVAGDWQPLATLVRLPDFAAVDCPASPAMECSLSGTNLFLLDSVSADAQFTAPRRIPEGFTDRILAIPHPQEGKLYVKLRDDPSVVSVAVLNTAAPQAPVAEGSAAAAAESTTNTPVGGAPANPGSTVEATPEGPPNNPATRSPGDAPR
jgi:hypothetical protein